MQLRSGTTTVLLTYALTYWLIFGGTFGGALSWQHQLTGDILVFLIIAGGGWSLWRRGSPTEYRSLPLGLATVIGLTLGQKAIAALFQQSWNSTEDFAASASAFIVFLLLFNWFQDESALTAICVSAAVICTLLGMALAYWRGDPELVLPLGNRVLMAGLLTLALPLASGRFRTCQRGTALRFLWLSGTLILAVGVIETRSAVAVALLPFALLLPLVAAEKKVPRVVAVLGLAMAILGGSWYFGRFEPLARVSSIVRGDGDATQSWDNRFRYWTGALPAISERPFVGWGSGQVGVTYPPFRNQRPGYSPPGEVVADLHSVPLQWAYEFGLLGWALRVAAFGLLLFAGYSRKSVVQRTAVISLTLFGVFSLLHYNLNNPGTIAMVTAIMVMAAQDEAPLTLTVPGSKRLGLVLIGIAVAVLSFQMRQVYANYLVDATTNQPTKAVIEAGLRAGILDSRGGFYDAVTALRIDQFRNNGEDEAFLLNAADYHYRQSLNSNPWSPQITAAYGDFLMRSRRPCEAIETLERAVSLDFYFSLSHFNLANAYAVCRSGDQAATEAGVAILTTPALVYSKKWRADHVLLEHALDKSLEWLHAWGTSLSALDGEQLRRLEDFVRAVRDDPVGGQARAKIVLSEQVAAQLISDPFAYIFHRGSPRFEPTRVEIEGLDKGTWTPEGIGQIRSLRTLKYAELLSAYQQQRIQALMHSLE